MPTVYDRSTGQAVPGLSPDQAQAGLASGALALSGDAGPVSLVGKSGKAYQFAPEQVAQVLSKHPDAYRLQTPEEELAATVAREEQAKGLRGSLDAAGSSGFNQLLMGAPEALNEERDTPEEAAHREAVEAYHKTARLVGGAAGFGSSLLLGGEFFKGAELAGQAAEHAVLPAARVAEAGLAHKLAATAANYATQGAVMSSPQALIQAAAGDPKKAAETLMWGLGVGSVLGGGAGLAREGVAAAGDKLGALLGEDGVAGALDKFASDRTAKAIGAERSQLNKLSDSRIRELTDFAHEEGLIQPGMSRADVGEAVGKAHEKYGSEIGDVIKKLDGALDKAKPEAIDAAAMKPGEMAERIRTALDSPEMRMPMNADQARALEMVVDSANTIPTKNVNGTDVVSFEDAQNFVSALRKKWLGAVTKAQNEGGVKGVETVTALDQMKSSAYQVARDFLHESADKMAAASENPEIVGALAKAKGNYAKVAELEKWVATRERQEAGNRAMSLTDMITMAGGGPLASAGGAAGAAIGGALGGPIGATVGAHLGKIPGTALDLMAKRWMEDRGLVHLSAIAKRAAKEGPEVFSAVLASEGGKRLDATLGEVRDTLQRMAQRGLTPTPSGGGSDHLAGLLGDVRGVGKGEQYKRLTKRIESLATNPQALAAATAAASAPIAAASQPLGAAYQEQLTRAVQYLFDSMPKPPAPPAPFAPDHWEPSAAQKLEFHDKLEMMHNPGRAMLHMERGTLSPAHLNALEHNYGTVLGLMRQEIQQHAAEHPNMKLPRSERSSVGTLLGRPIERTEQPEYLRALQASYAPHGTGGPNGPPGKQRAPKGKIKNLPHMGSSFSSTMGPSAQG